MVCIEVQYGTKEHLASRVVVRLGAAIENAVDDAMQDLFRNRPQLTT
jgi:hypothetical protein